MDEQLKQLFDYTRLHIGMYTTLVTAIVAHSISLARLKSTAVSGPFK